MTKDMEVPAPPQMQSSYRSLTCKARTLKYRHAHPAEASLFLQSKASYERFKKPIALAWRTYEACDITDARALAVHMGTRLKLNIRHYCFELIKCEMSMQFKTYVLRTIVQSFFFNFRLPLAWMSFSTSQTTHQKIDHRSGCACPRSSHGHVLEAEHKPLLLWAHQVWNVNVIQNIRLAHHRTEFFLIWVCFLFFKKHLESTGFIF